MRTHEPCDWACAIEQMGGEFLLEIVTHELFMPIMDQTLGFMVAMINSGYIGFDEKSRTILAEDDFLEQALIRIMLEAQEELDDQSCELVIYVITATLESSRYAMRWQDLDAHERTSLEAAYLNYLRRNPEQLLAKGESAMPADDHYLPTMIRFLVWGAHNQGRLPSWYEKAENEILRLAEQTEQAMRSTDSSFTPGEN